MSGVVDILVDKGKKGLLYIEKNHKYSEINKLKEHFIKEDE